MSSPTRVISDCKLHCHQPGFVIMRPWRGLSAKDCHRSALPASHVTWRDHREYSVRQPEDMEWIIHATIASLAVHVIGDPGGTYSLDFIIFQMRPCLKILTKIFIKHNTQNVRWYSRWHKNENKNTTQFMGCVISRIHYGLKVIFYFKTFYCLPLSSLRKTHRRHWTHINVCRVSSGGVSSMLLVLSITFNIHDNIWGCMCSTGPFNYRWLKGYIYSSCYYHHQIRSNHLSHCFHIFPWLCAWDVCYIIFCHLLYIHTGKTGNLFSWVLCSLWWVPIIGYVWLADRVRLFVHYTIS